LALVTAFEYDGRYVPTSALIRARPNTDKSNFSSWVWNLVQICGNEIKERMTGFNGPTGRVTLGVALLVLDFWGPEPCRHVVDSCRKYFKGARPCHGTGCVVQVIVRRRRRVLCCVTCTARDIGRGQHVYGPKAGGEAARYIATCICSRGRV
jgi:hypothetical protein